MNGGEDFLTSKKLIARKINSRKKNTKPSTKQSLEISFLSNRIQDTFFDKMISSGKLKNQQKSVLQTRLGSSLIYCIFVSEAIKN